MIFGIIIIMKRDFYNDLDSGLVYFLALIVPVVIGLILTLILGQSQIVMVNKFLMKVHYFVYLFIISYRIIFVYIFYL